MTAPRPAEALSTRKTAVWSWTRTLIAVSPLVVAAIIGVIVGFVGPHGSLTLAAPLPTVIGVVGLIMTMAILVAWLWIPTARAARTQALAEAAERGADVERAAHRRFLSRLDHELKNPVTAIRSALAVEGDAPADNVRIANGQATRLASLVGQLRGLSSLETRDIEIAPVDVPALVEEEVSAIREEARARGAVREITTTFPTVPWPLPPVAGDADLLAVVVRNVVLNAVKYSGQGARIEIRGSEDAGFVALDIADTGWGISAEDLPFVWDELWRARDARGVEGTGLGLSLVRVVLERHGGDAALRSQPGQGTSVRLRIPIAGR